MILSFYLAIGVFTGFTSGLLGIGGGTIIVPCLLWIFIYQGWPDAILMQMAAGTSLAVMILTTTISLWAHLRHGIAIRDIFRFIWPGIILGTVIGALIADFLHTHTLTILFGLSLILVAGSLFIGFKPTPKPALPGKKSLVIFSSIAGIFSGMLGIGSAVLTVPYLTYCNIPLRKTFTVSIACGILVSLVGTISYMLNGLNEPNLPPGSIGYVYWPGVLGIGLTSPLFAWLGALASHRISVEMLRRVFAIFLLVVAVRMLWV